MRIVEINSVNTGSTGNIMLQIAEEARNNGMEVLTCVPKSRSNLEKKCENQFVFGDRITRNLHIWLAQCTGFQNCFSVTATLHLLKRITAFSPDIIHLHNLHGNYINLPMLFHYIKKHDIPVVWTLHDCWSFTGQCPHFTMVKCEKWKNGCFECPQIRIYPSSRVDRTRVMWKLKRKWFTGVKNMTIVTPSKWLANLVQQSFLKEYPVKVINNGIDLNIFKPTSSDFREKHGIGGEDKLVLFVSFGWSMRKGVDVIKKIRHLLEDKFKIIVIGITEDTIQDFLDDIICIPRTNNRKELAEIYSSADVLVNPTREEVLGMVNIEALACGTPVVTFNTGGSPECVDNKSGIVVETDDIENMAFSIRMICEGKNYSEKDCIMRAALFDKKDKFKEYIRMYRSKK